jgi:hypothetical protein
MRRWIGAAGLAVVIASGCASSENAATTQEAEAKPAKGRAELWQQNCSTCHNARSSKHYSDDEWDIAMMHMRTRGYVTAEETRLIREYIQAAN